MSCHLGVRDGAVLEQGRSKETNNNNAYSYWCQACQLSTYSTVQATCTVSHCTVVELVPPRRGSARDPNNVSKSESVKKYCSRSESQTHKFNGEETPSVTNTQDLLRHNCQRGVRTDMSCEVHPPGWTKSIGHAKRSRVVCCTRPRLSINTGCLNRLGERVRERERETFHAKKKFYTYGRWR